MTRINLLNPRELYDQHLMAEYREIFMIPAALKRSLKSKRGFKPEDIPPEFMLGRGHVKFFYDKGKYLDERYEALKKELKRRGYKLDARRIFPRNIFLQHNLFGAWSPSDKDLVLIRERLAQKIAQKTHWYRKNKGRRNLHKKI